MEIKWIFFDISTVSYSVLVNGTSVDSFAAQRGLQQGDPISPFLFLLVMEGYSRMLIVAYVNWQDKRFQSQP